MFCTRCGLINLKNRITEQMMHKPCPGADD